MTHGSFFSKLSRWLCQGNSFYFYFLIIFCAACGTIMFAVANDKTISSSLDQSLLLITPIRKLQL